MCNSTAVHIRQSLKYLVRYVARHGLRKPKRNPVVPLTFRLGEHILGECAVLLIFADYQVLEIHRVFEVDGFHLDDVRVYEGRSGCDLVYEVLLKLDELRWAVQIIRVALVDNLDSHQLSRRRDEIHPEINIVRPAVEELYAAVFIVDSDVAYKRRHCK